MTIGEWIENLAASNTSTEEDGAMLQTVLRQITNYKRAAVVYGVVYLEGQGTLRNRSQSIQAVAKGLSNAFKVEGGI